MRWTVDRKKDVIEKLRQMDALRQAEQNLSRQLELMERFPVDGFYGLPQENRQTDGIQETLEKARRRVQCRIEIVENALLVLDPEERMVADWLFVYPRKGNVQRLCQVLGVEQSTVYRRRERMLRKLVTAMFGE